MIRCGGLAMMCLSARLHRRMSDPGTRSKDGDDEQRDEHVLYATFQDCISDRHHHHGKTYHLCHEVFNKTSGRSRNRVLAFVVFRRVDFTPCVTFVQNIHGRGRRRAVTADEPFDQE